VSCVDDACPPVHAHRLHFDPWHVAVVVLAAALVALGAWVVIDNVTAGDSATDNATALIDDFNAAATANDGAKAMTMMTPDAVLWSNGDVITGAPAWGDAINTTPTLVLDRIAPVSVNGEYATTLVRYGVPGLGYEPRTSVFVYQLRDGKIARAWSFVTRGDGTAHQPRALSKPCPPSEARFGGSLTCVGIALGVRAATITLARWLRVGPRDDLSLLDRLEGAQGELWESLGRALRAAMHSFVAKRGRAAQQGRIVRNVGRSPDWRLCPDPRSWVEWNTTFGAVTERRCSHRRSARRPAASYITRSRSSCVWRTSQRRARARRPRSS
jgi:hypothetical protein